MIKEYRFDYDNMNARVNFLVDTDKFTAEMANATLQFFLWDYDEEADPVDEVMKKYAFHALLLADSNTSKEGVIYAFDNKEGFCKIDGSMGITLIRFEPYEFDENNLDVIIIAKDNKDV